MADERVDTRGLACPEPVIMTKQALDHAGGDGRVEKLPGFGKKSVEKILDGIAFLERSAGRTPLGIGLTIAEALLEQIARFPGVKRVEVAGSTRRGREMIGDIDLLCEAKDGKAATWDSDQMLQFTGENSEVGNLEMQSDLESSIVFYNLLGKQMFDQTATVDVSNLKDKLGQLTNFSVQVLFQSALWKMNMKRKMFGHMLKELNFRLLTLAGMNTDSGVIIWPKVVLPTDERERIETQNMELMMGAVSLQTISIERDRDFKEEQKRLKAHPIEKEDNIRVQGTKRVLKEEQKE